MLRQMVEDQKFIPGKNAILTVHFGKLDCSPNQVE
jgi:hypothetical protein